MKRVDKILRINFVTAVNFQLLARQEVNDPRVGFSYSQAPIPDALNVIYGTQNMLDEFPVPPASFFVMTEPPEVYRWGLRELAKYRLVLAPHFSYLKRLDNFVPAHGLLPWRIGVAHEFGRDVPNLSRDDILKVQFPTDNLLTTVMSSKWRTRMQRKRIALTNYLEKRLPNFIVFGREVNPIEDKFEALTMARFHLAIENSIHPGYFTEKLTDPLLVGNTVFYGGHAESLRGFTQGNIILIDPERPRQVLEQIKRKLDEPETQEVMDARSRNRAAILENLNLHRQVVDAAEREGLISSL